MGLLDGVLQFLEEKMFKRMEEQFNTLIDIMQQMNDRLARLIELQEVYHGVILGKGGEVRSQKHKS